MNNKNNKNHGSPPPRWVLKAFTAVNVLIYRMSRGRLMNRLSGKDICLVIMKGVRTGKVRRVPLMYVPYKSGVLLVASQGGAPSHPVWYHNLVACPDIDVEVHGRSLQLTARLASAEEKKDLWPVCVQHYPDYEDYRHRTPRDIPVFICE